MQDGACLCLALSDVSSLPMTLSQLMTFSIVSIGKLSYTDEPSQDLRQNFVYQQCFEF